MDRTRARTLAAVGIAAVVGALGTGVAVAVDDFPDVPDGHAFHDDIGWLAEAGVTQGDGDGNYRPADPVTRGSMAAFLRRLAGGDPAVDPVVDAATLDGATRQQLESVVRVETDSTDQALADNSTPTPILDITLPAGSWILDFTATVESDEQGVSVICSSPGTDGVYTRTSVGVNGGYVRFDTLSGSGYHVQGSETTVTFTCFKTASGPGDTTVTHTRVLATRVHEIIDAP